MRRSSIHQLVNQHENRMELDAYLHRINFVGPPKPDLETLAQLKRQHCCSIPYSNLDVQLGRPLNTDIQSSYIKLVEQRRGGWCYEMNGLLGAMLERLNDYWRLHNYPGSTASSFDFVHHAADEDQLSAKCHWLSTDAESPFMNALVYQRVVPGDMTCRWGASRHRFVLANAKSV